MGYPHSPAPLRALILQGLPEALTMHRSGRFAIAERQFRARVTPGSICRARGSKLRRAC